MPENDEPLDDLRAVGMTAGVTAARIIETIARDAQQQRTQQQRDIETRRVARIDQHAADHPESFAPSTGRPAPSYPETVVRVAAYDSPERRQAADQAMEAAGVPGEARHARNVSDLMNGADPQLAASATTRTKAAPRRTAKAHQRGREG